MMQASLKRKHKILNGKNPAIHTNLKTTAWNSRQYTDENENIWYGFILCNFMSSLGHHCVVIIFIFRFSSLISASEIILFNIFGR